VRHRHQPRAGIGNAGRACVTHQRHAGAAGENIQYLARCALLVMLMHGNQTCGDAIMIQQAPRNPRVFRGNDACYAQYLNSTHTDVGEISNGRRHYI